MPAAANPPLIRAPPKPIPASSAMRSICESCGRLTRVTDPGPIFGSSVVGLVLPAPIGTGGKYTPPPPEGPPSPPPTIPPNPPPALNPPPACDAPMFRSTRSKLSATRFSVSAAFPIPSAARVIVSARCDTSMPATKESSPPVCRDRGSCPVPDP